MKTVPHNITPPPSFKIYFNGRLMPSMKASTSPMSLSIPTMVNHKKLISPMQHNNKTNMVKSHMKITAIIITRVAVPDLGEKEKKIVTKTGVCVFVCGGGGGGGILLLLFTH